jgi:hypothetical protein
MIPLMVKTGLPPLLACMARRGAMQWVRHAPPHGRYEFQVGINNAATPAPPSIPTANTNMAITALASRLYLLWTLDMASSLRVPPPQTAGS